MTDRFVRDDLLEAVLRSRAGDTTPPDLRTSILAAVAADGRRRATRRRTTGRPWRLLAVAAILLGMIGTGLFVGTSRHTDDPLPPSPAVVPSFAAVTVTPGPSASTRQVVDPAGNTSADPCLALSGIATHAGAVSGGWTPGPRPDASSTVENGLIAAGPFETAVGNPFDNDIRLVDPATGTQSKVTDLGSFDTMSEVLRWSPSGTHLAYLVSFSIPDGGGCVVLFVWSPDGLVQRLASSTVQETNFDWAPDESAIAMIDQSATGASSLVIAPADGSQAWNLGTFCAADCDLFDGPMWSPDGRRIAITGTSSGGRAVDSRIVNVSDGSFVDLPGKPGIVRWLDDQTLLTYDRGDDQLATISLPMSSTTAGSPVHVAWPPAAMVASPDLAYALDWRTCRLGAQAVCSVSSVTVRDRSTGTDRVVWSRKGGDLIAFWSPDSRSIVVSMRQGAPGDIGIWTVGVDGSNPKRISDVPALPTSWQPVWR